LPSHEKKLNGARNARPKAIVLIAILIRRAGTAVIGIACIVGLVGVSFQAGAPGPEDPGGSGIMVRTEVTALWIPRALRDLAQGEAGAPVFRSPESLQTELKRRGLNDAWYALTYRGYQVNGDYAEFTQVRRISEAYAHVEEFQDMMEMAAGRPTRDEGREFPQATVEIIPDTLITANPLKAVPQLIRERAHFPNKRPGHKLGDGREN
jgi:hypothetical protein